MKSLEICKKLIEKGADPNIGKQSALYFAITKLEIDIVKLFLGTMKINFDYKYEGRGYVDYCRLRINQQLTNEKKMKMEEIFRLVQDREKKQTTNK